MGASECLRVTASPAAGVAGLKLDALPPWWPDSSLHDELRRFRLVSVSTFGLPRDAPVQGDRVLSGSGDQIWPGLGSLRALLCLAGRHVWAFPSQDVFRAHLGFGSPPPGAVPLQPSSRQEVPCAWPMSQWG